MKPATSSRPCIESAASWSAAIHPSVRSSSAATSARRQIRPITSLRYAAASSGVNRRSAARISTSSPRARRRASGKRRIGAAGDHQVQPRREVVEQEGHPVVNVARVDDVVVVEHQHDVVRRSRRAR